MKKLYFYLYLFGLLCAAEHSHGSEKNIEPKIKYFISAKQGDQTKKVEIDRFYLKQFESFKSNFSYETKKQFKNTKLKELVKPEKYYRKEENKKKTVEIIKNNNGDIEVTWDITQLLELAFPKMKLKHKNILLNLLASASYGKKSIKNDEPISELKKSDLMTACKLADITGNSRISKFAGFSLIKKLTGQELFETIELKNPHEYYIEKIEFIPGTNGQEFITLVKQRNSINKKWSIRLTHWKKDRKGFQSKTLYKPEPSDFHPGFTILSKNTFLTFSNEKDDDSVWQREKKIFKKNKLNFDNNLLFEVDALPKFDKKQLFIANICDSHKKKFVFKLCEIKDTNIKTIIEMGAQKNRRDHLAKATPDGKTIAYWNKDEGLFFWKWNEKKKMFSKKQKVDTKIDFPVNIIFVPETNGKKLFARYYGHAYLCKIKNKQLVKYIEKEFNTMSLDDYIYTMPKTSGQKFFSYNTSGNLLFFEEKGGQILSKKINPESGIGYSSYETYTKTFIQNPQKTNEFLFFSTSPPEKQIWEKIDKDFQLKKNESLQQKTNFKFVPETTGLEHIIATPDKIKYISPKLLPFNQLELCYSIFEKDKYPLEKDEKTTLNNLPENIQKLAKEKLEKQRAEKRKQYDKLMEKQKLKNILKKQNREKKTKKRLERFYSDI